MAFNIWSTNQGLQVVAVEPQQGLVDSKLLMLTKSQIRIPEALLYILRIDSVKINKQSKLRTTLICRQVKDKPQKAKYNTLVKAIQIVGLLINKIMMGHALRPWTQGTLQS